MRRVSPWRKLWVKVRYFEFWPFNVFYAPLFLYYFYLSIRSRSFVYFTASNPSIETGGFLGESKADVFKLIPKKYLPETQLFKAPDKDEILEFVEKMGVEFPFILKPDVGERGRGVAKIQNAEELSEYLAEFNEPILLQEFVPGPVELGVFYIREPIKEYGRVTSIVKKGFLTVTGDGSSTVEELLSKNVRAMIQVDFNQEFISKIKDLVPSKNQKFEVESIGNHCRGTTFLNANNEIDDSLHRVFDEAAKSIDGFYFGRFDIRCKSFEELRKGNFKILELNGAGSEPGHIYQPGYGILRAYKDVFWHFKMLQKVSVQNHKRGVKYWSLKQGLKKRRELKEREA